MKSKRFEVNSKELEETIGHDIHLSGVQLYYPSTIMDPKNNSIVFCIKELWKDEYRYKINELKGCLIILESNILSPQDNFSNDNDIVFVDNPKLMYIKVIEKALHFSRQNKIFLTKDENVVIGENVIIGKNTIIEPFVFIDHDVEIGDNCIIKSGVKIRSNVYVGNNCIIGENTVIGAPGLSVATDMNGEHFRIPHLGGVVIENNVEIGAYNTIAAGTIEPTRIMKYVMTGERNQISHNCLIGKGALISGNVVVTGGVKVGAYTWLGPNSTIINGIEIGTGARVSIGAVVYNDVNEGDTVIGNPARVFNKKTGDKTINSSVLPDMYNRK